ncbi:hypothetical protein [Boudabousia marimammalium]|uniref:ATPase n=1 Tax=Boudabousia marimammalium TaxID=156892 RepID=A0A1Q5PRJ7_9ACTO|nr:hypothetical protein [Boudabousia marimammalium]OKL50119.1 hypothetical protein BM477_01580 [Boudabousia marimammalium]
MSEYEESYETETAETGAVANDESTALALIDYVHDLVTEARALPMSASVLINKAQVLDLLEQIREALPRDVLNADDIVNRADLVLERATQEADARLRDAGVRAETILAEANEEAKTIQANATNQADLTINESNTRAEQIIADAQAQAERLISAEEVLQVATERGQQVTRAAETEADRLMTNANEYVFEKMNDLMQAALDVARVAEGGRDRIEQRMADRSGYEPEAEFSE